MKILKTVSIVLVVVAVLLSACAPTPEVVEVTVEVTKEVVVEVTKEVPVEVVVTATPAEELEMPDLGGQEILVGSETTFPPWEFVDDNKNVVGFEPDMLDEMCQLVNCKPIWKSVSFEGIFTSLMTGDFDIIMASIHVTEERDEIVDFTIPYYEVGEVVTVLVDEDRIQSYKDLLKPGIITSIQTGSTGESSALEFIGIPEDQLKRYPGLDTQYLALVNGDVDAVISGNAAAETYSEVYEGQLKIVGGEGKDAWFVTRAVAIVVREGDDELRLALNAAIQKVKEDGTLDRLLAQWEIE